MAVAILPRLQDLMGGGWGLDMLLAPSQLLEAEDTLRHLGER